MPPSYKVVGRNPQTGNAIYGKRSWLSQIVQEIKQVFTQALRDIQDDFVFCLS